jgi:type I restriction enzyme R subunit
MRNRYKDETLDLKWAGAKVRKLIDKHVQSFGIDPKVPPVKLLSPDFPKEIDKYTGTPRSKASEMEHAIRHHIKVNLEKDPSLYTKFNERLERILKEYKEKWDLIVLELSKLRDDMATGRTETEAGVSSQEAPFFELMKMIGFGGQATREQREKLKQITRLVYERIRQALQIPNLWQKASEVRRLTNEIDDELQYAGIAELRDKHDQLTTEVLNLAKNREAEIKRM